MKLKGITTIILACTSLITGCSTGQEEYDLLNKIAPVVAYPRVAYLTDLG